MDIRETSLLFSETEGEGPISASTTLSFPRPVRKVAAGISGYTARFEDDVDRPFGRLEIEVGVSVDADDDTVVNVSGVLGLRDWSNEFDDLYSGVVDVTVLAELVMAPTPLPGQARGDLIVVGAEASQVVQHFRSAEHLDVPNVFPDNSIRLVASKPTFLRLYVDYDASSGLPIIGRINGELTVEGNGGTTTTSAIDAIVPRRDVSIDRGNRSHTLNFLIPEGLCTGVLTLRASVFDAADRAQFAAPFVRDLSFDTQPNLRVMAVGIAYTGHDVVDGATEDQLAAPVEADFVATLDFTEALYPVPEVEITSYETIEYDEDTVSNIAEGCDKLANMRDAVGELRGDSDDIVYGMYNVGVDTGTVNGCGGGGVGVGLIGAGATAAHEIGHALGRKHAPCDNVTRCAQPRNTDDDYPVYSGYDSDSMGEYGLDPRTSYARVIDPANGHDFMGYSDGEWVSPYTYKALLAAVPVDGDGGAATAARSAPATRADNEWLRGKQPLLCVRLDIARDGEVELQPSFAFPARPRPSGTIETDYAIEMVDGAGHVLTSTCLFAAETGCGCDCGEGPRGRALRIRQAVPFPAGAARMRLARCEQTVEEWEIPDPPEVDVDVECPDDDGPDVETGDERSEPTVTIKWKIRDKAKKPGKGYRSLIQWRDRYGTWRGCTLRTTKTLAHVPRASLGSDADVHVRVLVTSGIATGVGEWHGRCGPASAGPGGYGPRIVLTRGWSDANRSELDGTLRVAVIGPRTGETGTVRWYRSDGGELGRGRSLDLRGLEVGQTTVAAALVGASDRVPAAQWLVERTVDGRLYLLRGDQHPPDPCAPTGETNGGSTSTAGATAPGRRPRSTTHSHDAEES
jgi:hypothetical protein